MRCAGVLLALVALAGCGGGGHPAGPSAPQPSPTPGRLSSNRVFDIALVIADPRGLSTAQASAIATQAVAILRSRAGWTAAFLPPAPGSGPGPAAGAQWLAARGPDAPEAVVVFSDDAMARTYGGHASSLTLPAGAPPNEFPAPGQPADGCTIVHELAHSAALRSLPPVGGNRAIQAHPPRICAA